MSAHPSWLGEAFRDAPLASRLHVGVRWRLMPFLRLLDQVAEDASGVALDLGCGHGVWPLLLAEQRPGLRVLGLDPDLPRVEVAQAIADRRGLCARFLAGRIEDLAASELRPEIEKEIGAGLDLISVIDVLYLIPREHEDAVFRSLVGRLRPGGRVFLKEMGDRPRWKRRWNEAQERLAVKLLGITLGSEILVRSEAECRSLMERAGLRVREVPLDAGYLHPHRLFIGEKPGA